MATKRFKALPKDSQRAAFAQMDKDGTRQGRRGGGGGFVGGGRRQLDNMRGAISRARREFADIAPAKEALDYSRNMVKAQSRLLKDEEKGTVYYDSRERALKNEIARVKEYGGLLKKEVREFKAANAIKRSFRIKTGAKQGKLF